MVNTKGKKEMTYNEITDLLSKTDDTRLKNICTPLLERINELEKTLEWYADEDNWDAYCISLIDRGKKARQTLKGKE